MTRNNPEADMELVKLHKLHEEEALSKARIKQDVQSAYEVKLTQLRFEKSILANRALKAGASKTSIGRAVGTSNFTTVQGLLDLTKDQFVNSAPTPEMEVDPVNKTVTYNWIELHGDRFSHEITYPIAYVNGKWSAVIENIFDDPYYKWAEGNMDRIQAWGVWSSHVDEEMQKYE